MSARWGKFQSPKKICRSSQLATSVYHRKVTSDIKYPPQISKMTNNDMLSHRRSVTRRRYTDCTPLSTIVDGNDAKDMEYFHERHQEEILDEVRTMAAKYNLTIFDLCLKELESHDKTRDRKRKEWMKRGGAVKLISLCAKQFDFDDVRTEICNLAGDIFAKDIRHMIGSKKFHQRVKDCTPETVTQFDPQHIWNEITSIAPRLAGLFWDLVKKSGKREDGLASEGMPDEEEDDSGDETSGDASSDTQGTSREQRKFMIMVNAIAGVCYARNQQANYLQMNIGYWLYAAGAPKEVIEILHQYGITVTYKTVTELLGSIAESAKKNLLNFFSQYPQAWWCADNMDFYQSVRDQRQNNQPGLTHNIVAYAAVNPKSTLKIMLTTEDVNLSRYDDLEPSDLTPTEEERKTHMNAIHVGVFEALKEHFKDIVDRRDENGQPFQRPCVASCIYQIPPQTTIVHTCAISTRNETSVAELSHAMKEFITQFGMEVEILRGKKILTKGDQLTVRNMR